jgi:hypothetical protein
VCRQDVTGVGRHPVKGTPGFTPLEPYTKLQSPPRVWGPVGPGAVPEYPWRPVERGLPLTSKGL